MLHVIKEMQIKTVRCYYTLTQLAKIWNTQHQMLRKMWYNSNSLSLLIEIQNGTTTLEDNLAVSYKVKHSIWSNSCIVWYLPPKMESLHPHENLHKDACRRFIYKDLKQLRCPSADEWKINCGTSRQCYVIQCSKEEFSSHRKMWKNFKCIVLGERKDFPGVKNLPANADSQEMWVWSLGREDLLEKEMATYSSILAWKIPWTEEPFGLQFMGLQRVGRDWAAGSTHTHTCTRRWTERLWRSGKGKIMETAKWSVVAGVGVWGEGRMEYRRFWGQWKHSMIP